MTYKFMDKVKVRHNGEVVECLFIAYYRMYSLHKRCLLHCPKLKESFFDSLTNIIE
jgi:hypothetical protein